MARIRSTHPGQWTSGDFLECSPLARLLALALRNVADDHGVFRWKPTTLKAECLPGDNCEIISLLDELISNNQIMKYAVDGKEYGLIKDFTQWQRPKKPKYIHPVPPEFSTSTVPAPNECGTKPEIPPQRKEVGGRRKDEKKENVQPVAKATRPSSDKFEEFWKERPRRDGDDPRKPAEKKFYALVKTGVDPDVIISGAKLASAAARERGIYGTKFVPQTIKWLNDQRFVDYAAAAYVEEQQANSLFYAKDGSEQLDAWDAYTVQTTGRHLPRDRNQGWHVATEWPPGYEQPKFIQTPTIPHLRSMDS